MINNISILTNLVKVAYSIDSSVLSNVCIYRLTVFEYSIDVVGIAASIMQDALLSKYFIYRLIVVEQLLTLSILLTFQ